MIGFLVLVGIIVCLVTLGPAVVAAFSIYVMLVSGLYSEILGEIRENKELFFFAAMFYVFLAITFVAYLSH